MVREATTRPVKFQVAAGSLKKLQVRGRFFKKLYRDGLKLPRRQEADSMTATCWHSKTLCLFLLRICRICQNAYRICHAG